MIVASKTEISNEKEANEKISKLLSHEWKQPLAKDVGAFTDSFAPVEYYALMMR
jgi:hypothetical protein